VIRVAVLADAEGIARVHVATWRAAYRGILPDSVLAEQSEAKRTRQWREWLVRDDIAIVVSESDGIVTGFASSGVSRDADAKPGAHEIHAIYVDPSSWRSGYGRALMARTIELARAKGATSLTLWVLEKNDPARRFYESLGFALDGGRKESDLVELRYAIALTPP
jgi:GNAT superfamily N-acetyltransferase